MAGDGGGHELGQQLDDLGGEIHGGLRRVEQGPLVLPGHGQALGVDVQIPGDHQGGDVVGEELGKALRPLLGGQALQHFGLRHADHLQAALVKVVEISRKLQTRPVHVLDSHQGRLIVRSPVHHGHLQPLHQLRQVYAAVHHIILDHLRSLPRAPRNRGAYIG